MIYTKEIGNPKDIAFAILDIETTDLDNKVEEIVNVGIVECTKDFSIVRGTDYWFNPTNRMISVGASAATGLTNYMVHMMSGGDLFTAVQEKLKQHLLDLKVSVPIVAHNSKFDIPFIDMQFNRWGDSINLSQGNIIDSIEIARRFRENGKDSLSLDNLMKTYNIDSLLVELITAQVSPNKLARHTGIYDCVATMLLLKELAAKAGGSDISALI